ncbi:hypothetical protein I7I51_02909 [Histoplasma capsulatum]|uniref:Uncharacterized protein n=1 Tax=Ajellomyces capsulatus TaxID=5037 RepID=A0A8A1MNC4_AJECA|nr:hypothetical protein I7I51_02909 [Histoplasma capsulatum]
MDRRGSQRRRRRRRRRRSVEAGEVLGWVGLWTVDCGQKQEAEGSLGWQNSTLSRNSAKNLTKRAMAALVPVGPGLGPAPAAASCIGVSADLALPPLRPPGKRCSKREEEQRYYQMAEQVRLAMPVCDTLCVCVRGHY